MNKRLLLFMSFVGFAFANIVFGASHPSLSRIQTTRYVNENNQDVTLGGAGFLDTSLRSVGSGKVLPTTTTNAEEFRATAVQSDGKIVAVGTYSDGSNTKPLIARFLDNGVLDTSFGSGLGYVQESGMAANNHTVTGVAIQSDGKIVMVGYDGATDTRGFVIRYTTAGARDSGFGTGGLKALDFGSAGGVDDQIHGLAIQPDGKIIVAGWDSAAPKKGIVGRLLADGSALDTSNFGGGDGHIVEALNSQDTQFYAVALQSDGKVVAVGQSNAADFVTARYKTDGTTDTTFANPNGYVVTSVGTTDVAYGVAVQTNGKILVSGTSDNDFAIVRYDVDGSVDTAAVTFDIGTTTTDDARGLALQDDGKIIMSGTSDNDFAIIRLTSALALDTTFSGDGKLTIDIGSSTADTGYGVAVQSDDRIVMVGKSVNDPVVVRLTSTGQLDTSFVGNAGFDLSNELAASKARAMAVQSDGKIVVALDNGTNTEVNRYLPSGVVDSGFTAVTLTSKTDTQNMIVDSSDRIIICGGDNSTADNAWAYAIPVNGGSSTAFTGHSNFSGFNAIGQLSTGQIVLGGSHNTGAVARVAVFDYDGQALDSTWSEFDGDAASTGVYDLLVDSSDNLYIVYKETGGAAEIAKYSAGSLDVGFDGTGGGGNGRVTTSLTGVDTDSVRLAFDSSGDLVVAAVASGQIKVRGYAAADGTDGFAAVTLSQSSDTLELKDLRSTSDNKLYVVGCNATANQQFVYRLSGTDGSADTSFANSGLNRFILGANPTASHAFKSGFDKDGRLYVAGYQTEGGTDTPYLTRLFNTEYAVEQARFPVTVRQGDLSATFASTDGTSGILRPFQGIYGSHLQQKPQKIVEISHTDNAGKFLMVSTGLSDTSATGLVHVFRLTSAGNYDTSFNTDGKITLAQADDIVNETVTAIVEDKDGNFIIAGYSDGSSSNDGGRTRAVFRKIDKDGAAVGGNWPLILSDGSNSLEGLDVAIQSTGRILLFTKFGTAGRIYAYTPAGAVDSDFNNESSNAGQIRTTDLGLTNMGPVRGAAIDPDDDIVIAYRNSSTGHVDVARIISEGKELADGFNSKAILANVISSAAADQVRLALDSNDHLVVAAVDTANAFKVININRDTGATENTIVTAYTAAGTGKLNDLITVSDGSSVMVGYDDQTDDEMLIIRVKPNGGAMALDTTFNPDGATPGVLKKQFGDKVTNYTARVATGAAIKSTAGDILVTGYEQVSATESEPMLFSMFGTSSTSQVKQQPTQASSDAGVLDLTFDADGFLNVSSLSGSIGAGNARLVYAYRAAQTNDGKMLVAIEDATNTDVKVVRLFSDETIDTSFGSGGILTIAEQGVQALAIDKQEKVIVAGHNGGTPWAYRYTIDGATDKTFDLTGSSLNEVYAVGEQKSGRYVFAGVDGSSKSVIAAFKDRNSAGNLLIDTTFNPLGSTPGEYTITNSEGAHNLVIDDSDQITVAHKNSTAVDVLQLRENGTLNTSFGSSGVRVVTGVTPKNASEIKLAKKADNSFVVAIMKSAGGGTHTQALDTSGTLGNSHAQALLGTADVLAHLMIDNGSSDNKPILLGYQTSGTNQLWAMRINAAVNALDSTFNNGGTQGYLLWGGAGTQQLSHGSIYFNGRILIAGTDASTSGDAMLSRIYGNSYEIEIEQAPTEVAAGTFDTVFGSLNLDDQLGIAGSVLDAAKAQAVHMYNDGTMLLGFAKGSDIIIAKMNKDRTLDTSFNSGDTGGYEVITIDTSAKINDIFVANGTNDDGDIYIAGSANGSAWARRLSSAGVVDTGFTISDYQSMTTATRIRKQSSERVLLSGIDGSNGVVVGYNNAGALDTNFATSGKLAVGTTGIYDMAVDSFNRIYIAYHDGSNNLLIRRYLNEGTVIDSANFGTSGTVTIAGTAVSNTQIQLVLDQGNSKIYSAYQEGTGSGNEVRINAYNLDGTSAVGTQQSVTIAGQALQLTDAFVDADQKLYVAGYYTSGNEAFVARCNAAMSALDTYGTSGIGQSSSTSPTVLNAAALHPDRRVYLIGENGTDPFMIRFYGDEYVLEDSEALVKGTAGSLDTSLDSSDTTPDGGLLLSGGTDFVAYGVHTLSDGKVLVALGDGTNVKVAKYTADMQLDGSFGTSGVTATSALATVQGLELDAQGRILLSGTDAGAEKVIRISADGTTTTEEFTAELFTMTSGTAVKEQKSGRILVAGGDASDGIIAAYQDNGTAVDNTFGPAGTNGMYKTGVAAVIDDFVVDTNDDIFFVYRDTNVKLVKLEANGSGRVAAFNSGNIVDTGIVANSSYAARIGINAAGNVVVAATNSSNAAVYRYYAGADGTAATAVTMHSSNTPIVTGVTATSDNEFIILAYESAGTKNVVVGRADSAGAKDNDFDTNGKAEVNPGTSGSDLMETAHDVAVLQDGRILVVGGNDDGTADAVALRLHNEPYVTEVSQHPQEAAAGTLDTTLDLSNAGAMDLDAFLSGTNLDGYKLKRVHEYGDGIMLFAMDNGSNSKLLRLKKDLVEDTFGTGGVVDITSLADVKDLHVDEAGNIYVAGGSTTTWVKAYDSTGSAISGFSVTANLDTGATAIAEQTNQRVLLAGQDGSSGVIRGYGSKGAIDNSFGSSGTYSTGVNAPVADMSIDSNNRIVLVYANGGTSVLKRLNQGGRSEDSAAFTGTPTGLTGVDGDNLRVIHDNSGNIVVAGSNGDSFRVRRYTTAGVDDQSEIVITLAGASAAAELANIYVTADNKVVVVGYDSQNNTVAVARIKADFTGLDDTFAAGGTAGLLEATAGSMTIVHDATIHTDRRVMLIGENGSDPYIARVFGDAYTTVVAQAPDKGTEGTLDTTFNVGGTQDTDAALALSTLTGISTGMQPRSVVALSTGGHVIALHDGTNSVSKLLRLENDNTYLTTFHAGGDTAGLAADAPAGVQAMILTDSSELLLTGNDGSSAWLKRYDVSNGISDNSWSTDGNVTFGDSALTAKAIREQASGRILVSGHDVTNTKGVIYGFSPINGSIDTLFATNGVYSTGVDSQVETMAVDSKNRVVFAYSDSGTVKVGRLLPYGTLDDDFGTNGFVTTPMTGASDSMHLCIDTADYITIAAVKSGTVIMRQYDNTGAIPGSGFTAELDLSLTNVSAVTDCVQVADGEFLVSGYRSGDNDMFVARVTAAGALDSGFGSSGLMDFKVEADTATARVNNDIALSADGTISVVGYETVAGTTTPLLVHAYATPYETEIAQDQSLQTVGSVDGDVDGIAAGDEGILFYLETGSDAGNLKQKARAVNLYNNKYVVAVDGQSSAGDAESKLFLNQFDLDGNLDTTWDTNTGSNGWSQLAHTYKNEYVRDMITFAQGGSDKALLAGYTTSGSPLNVTQSLLMQYNLSSDAVDSTFGGIDGDASGTAFGDAKQFFKVGRQSNGRIIAAGIDQSNNGVLVGYTKTGAIDKVFGSDGCRVQETNSTGVYNFVVDAQDRVIVVYDNGSGAAEVACVLPDGSGLDSTFGTSGKVADADRITTVGTSDKITVALDQDQKIVVAAVTDDAGTDDELTVQRYDADGAKDGNALVLSKANLDAAVAGGITALSIVKVIVDADNAIYVLLRDDDASDDNLLIAKIKADMSGLDTSFASDGILSYQVRDASTTRYMTDAILQADGRITAVGYEE